ncbi:MAG: efflux RND transporter periplasmic adaptor subunit [Sediminibacterium sp. Gen4]|jgi:membrane fusion protein, multidrug efflux system|uniref:efflux RND transporter periplasmic adaptor subunit n=1 Tax=unclassified Sediminibacterium TaxID=2635961 RepID=UPI0015BB3212|nr:MULTISPECIES: efflux RND transporter periplasmic adaptor subunit [unclassified Sediminibacterium]MBW0160829.1 efflux RND transporter periplasmic adaptor subunit [Sediminibacterium sp.]MBW0164361.1 efflux RND transporter periplasmic adaptor subunit [Sediminibacterium sp.]NWK65234.1 efflux RND transporter periplasmic adaptor subunit [Sediminibacterium sp. Gen4]
MQKIFTILVLAASVTLVSCGAGSTEANSGAAAEQKAKLAELKKQKDGIDAEIAKLEAEIAKLDPASAKPDNAKLVALSAVAPETFTHYIDLQGKIESENISFVTPRGGGGQVKAVYIKRGDVVKKGQLILKLDDALQRQSVIAAEQGLETLKTQLSFAKTLYQKQKNLWEQNIGTEVQLITAKNNVETLENQLKSAEEQVKLSREQLAFTSVYSDVSGVAEDVNIRVGEIFAGPGQIKIVNTSNLKVTTEVPENYIDRVNNGTRLKITLPDINKTVEAKVSVSGKIINPISRSFFIEARMPNDKDFRPNQIAMVQIQDYTINNAITVPVNTLQNDEKGKYVMVAVKENGKMIAKKKIVVVGEFYGDKLEVKSGLQAGDMVITEGYQSLYDGQVITTSVK